MRWGRMEWNRIESNGEGGGMSRGCGNRRRVEEPLCVSLALSWMSLAQEEWGKEVS